MFTAYSYASCPCKFDKVFVTHTLTYQVIFIQTKLGGSFTKCLQVMDTWRFFYLKRDLFIQDEVDFLACPAGIILQVPISNTLLRPARLSVK